MTYKVEKDEVKGADTRGGTTGGRTPTQRRLQVQHGPKGMSLAHVGAEQMLVGKITLKIRGVRREK